MNNMYIHICLYMYQVQKQPYLWTISTTSSIAGPQLINVFLKRRDPTNVGETLFVSTVTFLSIPQNNKMSDQS